MAVERVRSTDNNFQKAVDIFRQIAQQHGVSPQELRRGKIEDGDFTIRQFVKTAETEGLGLTNVQFRIISGRKTSDIERYKLEWRLKMQDGSINLYAERAEKDEKDRKLVKGLLEFFCQTRGFTTEDFTGSLEAIKPDQRTAIIEDVIEAGISVDSPMPDPILQLTLGLNEESFAQHRVMVERKIQEELSDRAREVSNRTAKSA